MKRMQWKSKRTIALAVIATITYLMLRARTYSYYDFVILPKVKPSDAWEFVADFSNMKYLNPTIVNFNILEESGNYEHWKYTTQYSENLSHWPYLYNVGIAHFDVKADQKKNIYYVNSIHTTCLLHGFFCLDSTSEFKFSHSGSSDGTICEETIEYQCLPLMSSFCYKEVEFQRHAIMRNLRNEFMKRIKIH